MLVCLCHRYVKWVTEDGGPYLIKTMNSYTRVDLPRGLCATTSVLGLDSHKVCTCQQLVTMTSCRYPNLRGLKIQS